MSEDRALLLEIQRDLAEVRRMVNQVRNDLDVLMRLERPETIDDLPPEVRALMNKKGTFDVIELDDDELYERERRSLERGGVGA